MQSKNMILKVHKAEPIKGGIVRIDDEAMKIIQQMQKETGLSARKLISECVKFSSQHYEVIEV